MTRIIRVAAWLPPSRPPPFPPPPPPPSPLVPARAGLSPQFRLHKGVEVTVEHCFDVSGLLVATEVLHQLVGSHDVGADLISPSVVGAVSGQRFEGGLMFGPLAFGQFGPQNLHRLGLVLVLAPLVLARHHNAGRKMGESYRGVRLVHVLTSGPRRAVRVDT